MGHIFSEFCIETNLLDGVFVVNHALWRQCYPRDFSFYSLLYPFLQRLRVVPGKDFLDQRIAQVVAKFFECRTDAGDGRNARIADFV